MTALASKPGHCSPWGTTLKAPLQHVHPTEILQSLVKPGSPASLAAEVPRQEGWSHSHGAPRRRRRQWGT